MTDERCAIEGHPDCVATVGIWDIAGRLNRWPEVVQAYTAAVSEYSLFGLPEIADECALLADLAAERAKEDV